MKTRNRVLRELLKLAVYFWGIFFLFYFFVLYPTFNQYWYVTHEAVPIETMKKKWGNIPFDAAKFRNGTPEIRAVMAADLIQSRRYLGKSLDFVYKELGDGDLPRIEGPISEYTLESPSDTWKGNALYYLDFFYDRDTKIISDVSVTQECCTNSYATYWHAKGLLKLD